MSAIQRIYETENPLPEGSLITEYPPEHMLEVLDIDDYTYAWMDTIDALSEWMNETGLNCPASDPSELYMILGQEMGWRNRSGMLIANLSDGEDLLKEIIPERVGDFFISFKRTAKKHLIAARLSHHDSPTGEYYMIHNLSKEFSELSDASLLSTLNRTLPAEDKFDGSEDKTAIRHALEYAIEEGSVSAQQSLIFAKSYVPKTTEEKK